MKFNLAKIEARLQTLIEGGAARLFPDEPGRDDLASRLLQAMRSGLQTGGDGETYAPNLYTIQVHPSRAQALQENEALLLSLAQSIQEAGLEAGLRFPSRPVVRITVKPDLSSTQVQVLARNSLENLPQTTDLDTQGDEPGFVPLNAFLIVDGMDIFPLTQAVINIGRRSDNQLVIEDSRVSRLHAQLRVVRGRYVIFDLDSTGGTFVNGEPVRQFALYPGDVISLSGVPLVFGQDPSASGETQDYTPPDDGDYQ